MCCLNLLSVGVRMDPWNDWQELPACSNSLKSCSVALQPITNEMSVYQKQPAHTCLNYPCSTDTEIQLLNVLGTGTCNNDGVWFFSPDKSRVLTPADIIVLWCSTECVEGMWHTKQLSNLFSIFFLILDFLPCHLESSIAPEIWLVIHVGYGKKFAKLVKSYIHRKIYPCLVLGKYNRNLKSKLIFSKMIQEFTWMAM